MNWANIVVIFPEFETFRLGICQYATKIWMVETGYSSAPCWGTFCIWCQGAKVNLYIGICFYNLWKIFIIFKKILEMVPATFWSASMHTFSNIYFLTLEKRRTQPPSKIFHFYWILILTSYYRIFNICDPLE